MANHLNYYKYHVRVFDYDEDRIVYEDYFDDISDKGDYFEIMDKQNLGENIGASIIENLKGKINEITEKVGEYECGDDVYDDIDFTQDFKDEVMNMIETEITNFIRNDICEYVLDYLGNNL